MTNNLQEYKTILVSVMLLITWIGGAGYGYFLGRKEHDSRYYTPSIYKAYLLMLVVYVLVTVIVSIYRIAAR